MLTATFPCRFPALFSARPPTRGPLCPWPGSAVVYGDTDSIFVRFPGTSVPQSLDLARALAAAVTAQFDAPIRLEFEKAWRRTRGRAGMPVRSGIRSLRLPRRPQRDPAASVTVAPTGLLSVRASEPQTVRGPAVDRCSRPHPHRCQGTGEHEPRQLRGPGGRPRRAATHPAAARRV